MAAAQLTKDLLFELATRMEQDDPCLTKQAVIEEGTPDDLQGPRRKLYQQMNLNEPLEELIDEGRITYLGQGRITTKK